MAEQTRMPCPKCGMQMNHHADKVDYTAALDHPDAMDPVLGGVLQQVHQCPNPRCGNIELRRAPVG